jgi:hypothetical protein
MGIPIITIQADRAAGLRQLPHGAGRVAQEILNIRSLWFVKCSLCRRYMRFTDLSIPIIIYLIRERIYIPGKP